MPIQPRFAPTCALTSAAGARRANPGQAAQGVAHGLLVAALEQLAERPFVAVAGEAEDARDRPLQHGRECRRRRAPPRAQGATSVA